MASVLSLLFKIIKNPTKKITLSKHQTIYTFDKKDERYRIATNFIEANTIHEKSLTDFSWEEIILRKVRVTSIPRSVSLKSISDRLKCFLIRYLLLSLSTEIKILNIQNLLFIEKSKNIILTFPSHCYDLYRTHVKHFKTIETFGKYQLHISIPLYIISQLTKKKYSNKEKGTIVFTNPSSYLIILAFHNLHPKKNIVIRFHDILLNKDIQLIRKIKKSKLRAQIESYSYLDAQKENLIYRPNGVDSVYMKSLDTNVRTSLYRFYGAASDKNSPINNRVLALSSINEKLYTIYPMIQSWINYKITESAKNYIPYQEFVKHSALSEIYVDLARVQPSEGFSFRICEALFLNRKIITNRTILRNEPFYDPNRIFIMGEDSLERLKDFLEQDIQPVPDNILRLYDSSLWWTYQDHLSIINNEKLPSS